MHQGTAYGVACHMWQVASGAVFFAMNVDTRGRLARAVLIFFRWVMTHIYIKYPEPFLTWSETYVDIS